jgi:hypothetical protein
MTGVDLESDCSNSERGFGGGHVSAKKINQSMNYYQHIIYHIVP